MCGWRCPPEQVCFAVACPVDNEIIRFTNSHWAFSRDPTDERAQLSQGDVDQ